MSYVLRGSGYSKILFALILTLPSYFAYSQGCNGADGSGIYTGSIANRDNGTRCANMLGQPGFAPGLMEIDISNVDESGTIQFQINWDDGSAFQAVNATRIGPNRYFASVTHNFPANGTQVRCEYRPVVRLIYNGTVCNANLGTPPRFVRWNTDDQNTGELSLLETVTNVNEYLVCAGVETNVTFTDRSTLNCVPPDLTQGPNNQTRWRQFVYGTTNTITGTVRIGGTPRTFPYNGNVDQSGDPVTNSGFPTATTQIITVPATAQVGQIFRIRMNYWNTCNSYVGGRPPVEEYATIRVVAQPAAPTPNPASETVCAGATPTVPRINNPGANTTISWWRNNPGDTPGTLIRSGTSTQLNWNQFPGYNGDPGVYKVWVSYRQNVANALNCESPKVLITRTIREPLSVPNPVIAPTSPVCQGTNVSITLPAAATETVGGATNYVFSATGGMTLSSNTATSATYNTSGVTFSGSNLTATVNVRVARRYTPSNACQVQRDFPVTVHRTPVGGTPSNFPDVCEGTPIGPINLSGHIGVVDRWQMSTDGGPYVDMPGTAGQTSISPGVLTSDGVNPRTYRFRAIVGNGPCATVFSAIEQVIVSPNPGITADAGADIEVCNVLAVALNGSDPNPGTGTWSFVSSFPAGKPAPTFSDANDRFATVTASVPGEYTLRWTVSSGLCESIDEVVVDFGASPALPVLTDIEECGTSTTLNAPVLTAGVGTWSVVSGNAASVAIADVNDNDSQISLVGPPFDHGTYTLRWTVVSGSCPVQSTDVDVTFYSQPTIVASNINNICLDPAGTSIPLTATLEGGTPEISVGNWTIVSGNGSIANVVSGGGTVTAEYLANNQDYIDGTDIVVRVTSTIGGFCPDASQDITIDVDKTPIPIAGTNPTPSCNDFVQLNATAPVDAVGQWTGPGVTFDDPSDPKTIVRNLPAPPGTVDLVWTLTSTGGNACTAFDQITIQSVARPNASDYSPIMCEVLPAGTMTTQVTLADFEDDVTTEPVADRTIQWFENGPEGFGVPVADPSVTLVGVPENKIFVAKIVDNASNCSSNAFVTINIRPLPVFNNATLPLCEDSPGMNTHSGVDLVGDLTYRNAVTSPTNNVVWFETFSDAANNTPPGGLTPTTFDVIGSRNVFARIEYPTGESCPIVASLNLVVNQIPVANISGDPTVCMGTATTPVGNLPVEIYQTSSFSGAKYFWDIPTGPGEFVVHEGGDEDDFFVLLKFPHTAAPSVEQISVRIELQGCSFTVPVFPITRSAVPVPPTIVGDDFVCADSKDVEYSVQTPSANDYTWRFFLQSNLTQEGGALVATGQNTPVIRANFQTVPVRIQVIESNSGNNECASEPAFMDIMVNPLPKMMPTTHTICSGIESGVEFVPDTSPGVSATSFFRLTDVTAAAGLTATPGIPATPTDGLSDMVSDIVYKNTSEIPKNVVYQVSPVNETMFGGVPRQCVGSSVQVVLTVNPEPTLENGLNQNVCSDEQVGITLAAGINSYPADSFVIADIDDDTSTPGNPLVRTGSANIGDIVGANGIYTDRWANPGSPAHDSNTPYEVTYWISARSSVTGCIGTPAVPIRVRVFPVPDITFVNNPVCSEDNVNIDLTAANVSGANTSWTWTVENVSTNIRGAEPGSSPSGNTAQIDDQVVNESFIAGTVVYEVTATTALAGKVCSAVELVSIVINPIPQVTPIPNTPICSTTPNNGLVREIDLTALESTIADPGATNIVWYDADPETNPGAIIGDPSNYPVQNGVPVYAQVTETAFGCAAIVPVTYTVNNALAIDLTETDVSCNGANNGSIFAEVTTGGTAPFFFRRGTEPFVSAAGTSYTFLALAPNTYTITVQDSKGCSATMISDVIEEPTPLLLTSTTITPVDCFFDAGLTKDRNGRVEFIADGSTGNYTYTLFPGGLSNQTGIFENLRPGSYSVVVNDFGNVACKLEFSPVIVTVPGPIEVLPVFIPTDSDGNQISCAGAENGEVHVTARGGTGEFDFTINPVNPQNPIHQLADVPAVFAGLGAGTYTITIVDGNGCVGPQTSATITNILDLFPGKIGTDQDVCFMQADAFGDAEPFTEVILPFGGPTSNYEYIWQESVAGGPFFDIPGATSATYDPDALNPFAFEGQFQYRRLIRTMRPVVDLNNRPAFCDTYKGETDIVTINVRPKPMVTVVGNSFTCQGNDEFYSLRLDVGTAPMRFSWFDGDFTFNNQTANQLSAPYKVSNIQNPVTVGFSNISDSYGCIADDAMIDIDIISVDAEFSVDAFEKCAGDPFMFTYNNQPGTQYIWEFGDGTVRPYPADDPALDGTEDHTYPPASSSQGDASFIVKLTAALDGGACPNSTFKTVTVKQAILLNIIGAPNEICSGQTITMTDNSTGVTSGTWYTIDQHGNRSPDIAGPLSQVTFALINTGTDNPLNYTIHYESENDFGCNGPAYSFPVTVYRGVDADFTINPNPAQMIGGIVDVEYTNTSDPLDPAFIYQWDYKEDVVSVEEIGTEIGGMFFDRRLQYSSDKQRDITLTVTNPLRPQCTDTRVITLNVDIENPTVDFRATRAGCYPLTVTVQNLSVSADKFLWELSSTNGTNEKSSLREPTFNIYDPGTYTLTLTAQKEGNPNFVQVLSKTIEVFPKPLADFFLRQNQAYTGSQIKPVNQSQFTCGNCYTWDFGDGFTYDGVFEPSHFYTLEGKYTVTLAASVDYGEYDIDDDGVIDGSVICSDETSQEIRIIDGGAVKIPNAFTPNVNGPTGGIPDHNFTNDVFLPIMDGVEEFTMEIFDRWGNMIFQSRDKNIGWDGYDRNGKLMPAGVYVYKLVMRLGDGQRTTKVGDVTLIR